jgi:hypothetical protein
MKMAALKAMPRHRPLSNRGVRHTWANKWGTWVEKPNYLSPKCLGKKKADKEICSWETVKLKR